MFISSILSLFDVDDQVYVLLCLSTWVTYATKLFYLFQNINHFYRSPVMSNSSNKIFHKKFDRQKSRIMFLTALHKHRHTEQKVTIEVFIDSIILCVIRI